MCELRNGFVGGLQSEDYLRRLDPVVTALQEDVHNGRITHSWLAHNIMNITQFMEDALGSKVRDLFRLQVTYVTQVAWGTCEGE